MATSLSTQTANTLTIRASSANRVTTLTCEGKLVVGSAAGFIADVKRWTECSSGIVVDVTSLTFMDSAGLGGVVSAYTSAKKAGCEFRLTGVTPRVMRLLQMTNLASILQPTTENLL